MITDDFKLMHVFFIEAISLLKSSIDLIVSLIDKRVDGRRSIRLIIEFKITNTTILKTGYSSTFVFVVDDDFSSLFFTSRIFFLFILDSNVFLNFLTRITSIIIIINRAINHIADHVKDRECYHDFEVTFVIGRIKKRIVESVIADIHLKSEHFNEGNDKSDDEREDDKV